MEPTEITQEPAVNEEPEVAEEEPAVTEEPVPEQEPDATLVTDENGNSQFIMADGSNCISTEPLLRLSTQPGYYDQLLSISNKCNFSIVLNVCNLDGTCNPVTVAAAGTVLHVLGTTYGVSQSQPPQGAPQAPPTSPAASGGSNTDNSPIDFGDDNGNWPNDGECDDPRFSGAGAAANPLDADYFHDASDCQAALNAGTVAFIGYVDRSVDDSSGIDFGDDSSSWANDGECDDPRFSGTGAAAEQVEADLYHDASDCRTAYLNGTIVFTGYTESSSGYSDDYDIGDAIGDVLDAYGDYLCAKEGGCENTGGDYDSGGYDSEDSGDYGGEEDDCNFNSDGDPNTVCTVQ